MRISSGRKPDYFLLALIFILVLGGLIILTSASSDLGKTKFNDSYYYLKHQALSGLIPGIVGFVFAYFWRYTGYRRFALPLLILNLAVLCLVFTPLGITAGGASRWVHIGPIVFQPAEFLKLTFIIYLAAWLSGGRAKERTRNLFSGFLPFLIVCGIIAGILVMQPATSTVAILLVAGLSVYFMSGVKLRYIAAAILLGVAVLAALVYFTPYRLKRVSSFLNPDTDSQGANYHSKQALIAIGSGGLTGMGYGQSAAKIGSLPAVVDDSVFAVVGQELGFIGSGILLAIFATLVLKMFWLAKSTQDIFGRLLLVGFATIIGLQSMVNIGAISGVLPLTGVPLPFISYGGTALAVFLTMTGIAVNISKYS